MNISLFNKMHNAGATCFAFFNIKGNAMQMGIIVN